MSGTRRAIETITAALREARASAAAGASLDLSGLEAAAADALQMAKAAPLTDRTALLSALASLAAELDELAVILRQQRADAQRRAATAYGDAAQRDKGDR